MLKISAKSEYAIILVTFLIEIKDFMKINEISLETNINEPILRKIANKLEKWGLIISNKWRNGGIKIAKKDITVFEVLNSMWENLWVAICSKKICHKAWDCKIWWVIKNLQKWLESVLRITKI